MSIKHSPGLDTWHRAGLTELLPLKAAVMNVYTAFNILPVTCAILLLHCLTEECLYASAFCLSALPCGQMSASLQSSM